MVYHFIYKITKSLNISFHVGTRYFGPAFVGFVCLIGKITYVRICEVPLSTSPHVGSHERLSIRRWSHQESRVTDTCTDSSVILQPYEICPVNFFEYCFEKTEYSVFVEYRAFKMSTGLVLVLFLSFLKSVIYV